MNIIILLAIICLTNAIDTQLLPYDTPDPNCSGFTTKNDCLSGCNCFWCTFNEGTLCYSYLDTTPDPCKTKPSKIVGCLSDTVWYYVVIVFLCLIGCCCSLGLITFVILICLKIVESIKNCIKMCKTGETQNLLSKELDIQEKA